MTINRKTVKLKIDETGLVKVPEGAERVAGQQPKDQTLFRVNWRTREVILRLRSDNMDYVIGEVVGVRLHDCTPTIIIGLALPIEGSITT